MGWFESDIEDSEVENEQDNKDSDSGSDISVSTVNTKDLSDLSFLENEGDCPLIVWSHDHSPVNVTAFTSAIVATSTVPEDGTMKDFCLFVSEELLENIVEEINRYARQCIARSPEPKWYETNLAEMQVFCGLQIFFSMHVLPETSSLFWSDDPALGVPFVKRVIARNRFDKLYQHLHLNKNENLVPRRQPNHDKLFKVLPFLDSVVKNLSPRANFQWNNIYPWNKVKRGIKIWECADSSNGYLCNLQVYTGKQDGGVTEHGLGYCFVRELTEPFLHKYHHVLR